MTSSATRVSFIRTSQVLHIPLLSCCLQYECNKHGLSSDSTKRGKLSRLSKTVEVYLRLNNCRILKGASQVAFNLHYSIPNLSIKALSQRKRCAVLWAIIEHQQQAQVPLVLHDYPIVSFFFFLRVSVSCELRLVPALGLGRAVGAAMVSQVLP